MAETIAAFGTVGVILGYAAPEIAEISAASGTADAPDGLAAPVTAPTVPAKAGTDALLFHLFFLLLITYQICKKIQLIFCIN